MKTFTKADVDEYLQLQKGLNSHRRTERIDGQFGMRRMLTRLGRDTVDAIAKSVSQV